MAANGTEGKIIEIVAGLGAASRGQIQKGVGISLDYAGYLLNYLVKKGELMFGKGWYSLPKKRNKKTAVSPKKVKPAARKKKQPVKNPFWWEEEKKKKK